MGVLDLVGKAAKGAKKAAPFFSKADVVLDELPRGKGLGNEFLGELVKKGAKPTELRERGIEKALKDKPKMTKAEVQKIFEEKAPPKVQEKVLSSESPDYEDFLEAKAQEEYGVDWFDLSKQEKNKIEDMFYELPAAQYASLKTPGGKNYREILLKLPERGMTKLERDELMLYEADLRRSNGRATPERMARYQELKAKEPSNSTNYIGGHYTNDTNLLAHMRVQDFEVPSTGYAVVNTRSGNKSEVFPTIQEAHAAMFQYPENMRSQLRLAPAQGKPKKVLLVDEIQSDWHQAARKKREEKIEEIMMFKGVDKKTASEMVPQDFGYKVDRTIKDLPSNYVIKESAFSTKENPKYEAFDTDSGLFWGRSGATPEEATEATLNAMNRMYSENGSGKVPDAPFKKNWHELAMKRILDYAAENGYDSIAITPGAEQAKRYDLSKQIGAIEYSKSGDDNYKIKVYDPVGQPMNLNIPNTLDASGLEQYIGKEMAEKVASQATGEQQSLAGLDLQVGGEGMKGFYDKILPDYLNNFGKPYGAQVNNTRLMTEPQKATFPMPPAGQERVQVLIPAEFMDVHSFDITPQLREEVKAKGLPLYSKTGMGPDGLAAGSGAATIGSQMFDENNEQQVQNPVHFTENPDAMLLELMQRN